MGSIEEVKAYKTEDGRVFVSRAAAEGHIQHLKMESLKARFVNYAEKVLNDIGDPLLDGAARMYIDVISDIDFENADEVVECAIAVINLWDGKFLKLVREIHLDILRNT